TATSSANLSLVQVMYEYGTDADKFESSLRRALDAIAAGLPAGAEPNIIAGSTAAIPVLFLTAADPGADDAELTSLVTSTVAPRLQAVDGVRSADVSGGAAKQVQISPDQQAMAAHGLSGQA